MRILLVEDDQSLQRTLKKLFITQHFAVDVTANGKEAIFLAKTNDYDIVVLDLMLPDISGFEVCTELRKGSVNVPILMLTALDEVDNRIRGLDTGADDYLPKPFHAGELLARIRALHRRQSEDKHPVLSAADLILDPVSLTVKRGGRRIELTSKEFALLNYLMENKNRILTREQISEHVWDINFDPRSNVIDAFIKLLRKKIDEGFELKLIRTVRGAGYTLSEGDNS
ncbi:MAG: response regulator transcription factor [Candidatus Kryptoniota bacterium]